MLEWCIIETLRCLRWVKKTSGKQLSPCSWSTSTMAIVTRYSFGESCKLLFLFQVLNTLEEMLLNIGTRRWRLLYYDIVMGKRSNLTIPLKVDGASSGNRAGSWPQTQPQGDDQQAHLSSLPQGIDYLCKRRTNRYQEIQVHEFQCAMVS